VEDNFGRGYGSPRTVMPEEAEVGGKGGGVNSSYYGFKFTKF
jgi:hypothetical protein